MKILFIGFCAPRPNNRTFGNFVHHMAKGFQENGASVDILVPVRIFPNTEVLKAMVSPVNWPRIPDAMSSWVSGWRGARDLVEIDGVRYFYRRFSSLPVTSRTGRNGEAFLARNREWLCRLARKEGYTHVVGHFLESLPLVTAVSSAVGSLPAAYVHEDVPEYLKMAPLPIVKRNLDKDTILFGNSSRTIRQIRDHLWHRNAHLAYLGVDQGPVARRAPRENGRFNIVCVSRFHSRKNQELLVKLASFWKRDDRSLRLRITLVGDSGSYRRKLEEMVACDELKDDVFFADATDHATIMNHMAEGDLFLFPSRFESFGLVLVEAAATGVPVAAAPEIGALQELRGLGWDIPVFDPDAVGGLAAVVSGVINNYPRHEAFAAALGEFIRTTFSWRKTARTMMDVLQHSAETELPEHPDVVPGQGRMG